MAQLYYFTGIATVLGAILTIIYLWTGIQPTNMSLYEWLYFAAPSFFMMKIVQLLIREWSMNKNRIPLIGVRAQILHLGANIVYFTAFILFIFRKRFFYSVTNKHNGILPNVVPLKTFSIHIALFVLSTAGLSWSLYAHNNSSMLRFWGVVTSITMFTVVISNYMSNIKHLINNLNSFIKSFSLTKLLPSFLIPTK